MKYFLTLLSLVFLANIFSQSELVGLRHYERKKNFDQFFFIGDKYYASLFNIQFPDSLYDRAKIEISKAAFNDIKGRLYLETSENMYQFIRFVFKGKRKLGDLTHLIGVQPNLSIPHLNEQLTVVISEAEVEVRLIRKGMRKYELTMQLKGYQNPIMFN